MLSTRFTELVGCQAPLQQAGMGGIAMPELAAAVARAGGLGMVAGVEIPADLLAGMLDELDADTRSKIGVNFLMPFLDEEAVKAAASRVRVVEFFYGDPEKLLVDLVHQGGALAFWQVGSLAEAKAAVDAGCDAIIAQGTEAGGHVRGQVGLHTLLAEVLDAVEVPVIAAGGIGTPRAMAAALAAGADAVRAGTVFVAAEETDAHPEYVDALAKARAQDTVLTEAFEAGWPNAPHRVLRSSIEAAERHQGDTVAETRFGEAVIPVARFAPDPPSRATTGNIQAMALYAGESVDAVRGLRPAAAIVRELADGAEALLRRW
jgi:nitronate monooxygenase